MWQISLFLEVGTIQGVSYQRGGNHVLARRDDLKAAIFLTTVRLSLKNSINTKCSTHSVQISDMDTQIFFLGGGHQKALPSPPPTSDLINKYYRYNFQEFISTAFGLLTYYSHQGFHEY